MTATTTGSRRATPESLTSGLRKPSGGPVAPRTRNWGLVIVAALLVIGSGLAAAAVSLAAGSKVTVVSMAAAVPKGQVIERDDVKTVAVAGVRNTIDAKDIDTVVGKTAASDLVKDQILTSALVTDQPTPGPGQRAVGLALDPQNVPTAGLNPGDVVDLVAVPASGGGGGGAESSSPVTLAEQAQVFNVSGEAANGAKILVTVIVDESAAKQVAVYSAQNRVAVIESTPTGSKG